MKLQGSEVQDHETLQSQIGKIAENRLPLSGLEIFHGRPFSHLQFSQIRGRQPYLFVREIPAVIDLCLLVRAGKIDRGAGTKGVIP